MNVYPAMKVRVTSGQYANANGKVIRVLPGFGASGFAEVKFNRQHADLPAADLVPLSYLEPAPADVKKSRRKL
ncbi:hypothetical protein [Paraburkholderia dokdonensis]|uniref:hypothetical protein n=1 Tax=Paraburkholderia dokdonensis TaxID=2211211 RepID=UPI00101A0ADB|nr:hypothetical protein [Paraburkholderia dokdonensis]